jgi:hypothetical protein
MGGVMLVECRCGQSFIATAGEVRCPECEAVRDELTCGMCGTTLRVAVPRGLCGMCDPAWDPERDAVAV